MPISKALRVGKFIITSEDIAPGAVTFADIGTIYSSNITENSNLFFSNARATAAIEASLLANLNIAGNLVVDSNVLYIDSVNNRVGVGTTTPTRLFTVQNDNPSGSATLGVRNQSSGTGAFVQITAETLGTTGYFYTFGSGYTSSGSYLANSSLIETNGTNGLGLSAVSANTNASIRFYTNQTERLRLDTAGNLGLGVTPSAWLSTLKVMQIGPRLGLYDTGTTGALFYNAYVNSAGNFIYSQSAAATLYDTASGLHRWYNAPSGTAGNAITFTQAMTLNASGNLGLGTTSPYSRLGISGDITLGLGPAPNGSYGKLSWRYGNSSSFGAAGYIDVLQVAAGNSGHMVFATNNNSPDTAEPTERVRIDSSGTFRVKGAGTAGSTDAFQVSGSAPASAWKIESTGHIIPGTTDAYDIGSTTNVVRNIYTGDLHLSNENKASGNSIDGSRGNWTIQEGANSIFIINNITGKSYKFVLEEI
jgi:hypothetical protein